MFVAFVSWLRDLKALRVSCIDPLLSVLGGPIMWRWVGLRLWPY